MKKTKIEYADLTPSNDGDWLCVKSFGEKDHIVHKCMVTQVIVELENKKRPVYENKKIKNLLLCCSKDSGGDKKDRPKEFVKIDCLSLTIPSSDVSIVVKEMKNNKPKKFIGAEKYHSVDCGSHILILTEEQFSTLSYTFEKLSDRATSRDNKYLNDLKLKNN